MTCSLVFGGRNHEVLQAVPRVVCKLENVVPRADVKSKLVEPNKYLEPQLCGKCEEQGIGISNIVEMWDLKPGIRPNSWESRKEGKGKLVCRELPTSIKTKEFRKAYVSTGAEKKKSCAWELCQEECVGLKLWAWCRPREKICEDNWPAQ